MQQDASSYLCSKDCAQFSTTRAPVVIITAQASSSRTRRDEEDCTVMFNLLWGHVTIFLFLYIPAMIRRYCFKDNTCEKLNRVLDYEMHVITCLLPGIRAFKASRKKVIKADGTETRPPKKEKAINMQRAMDAQRKLIALGAKYCKHPNEKCLGWVDVTKGMVKEVGGGRGVRDVILHFSRVEWWMWSAAFTYRSPPMGSEKNFMWVLLSCEVVKTDISERLQTFGNRRKCGNRRGKKLPSLIDPHVLYRKIPCGSCSCEVVKTDISERLQFCPRSRCRFVGVRTQACPRQ